MATKSATTRRKKSPPPTYAELLASCNGDRAKLALQHASQIRFHIGRMNCATTLREHARWLKTALGRTWGEMDHQFRKCLIAIARRERRAAIAEYLAVMRCRDADKVRRGLKSAELARRR